MAVSPAQARAARKWNAEHRDVIRKSVAKSNTKRFILKLADEDDLKDVQQWLAKRKLEDRGNKMTSAEKIYNQIKAIWGKEGFVPSDEDVKITKELRAELAATGSTEYNDKVNTLLKQGVINKNIAAIREKFEKDFEIDEDRVRNLHELGYYKMDLELDGMRNHIRRVRLANQENEWRKHHFTREIEAVRYRHPVIGSIFVKKTKDGYRVGKLASYEFVSEEDNVTSYGDIYVLTYDDITNTEEGKKALRKWLDATKN